MVSVGTVRVAIVSVVEAHFPFELEYRALLTRAILTKAILTRAILTRAILTKAILTIYMYTSHSSCSIAPNAGPSEAAEYSPRPATAET